MNLDFNPHQGHVEQADAYLSCLPSTQIRHCIQSYWQLNVPGGNYKYRSMPDNCVDLIFNLNSPSDIFIIKPFSAPKVFNIEGPVSYFGIRFQILGHEGLISTPLSKWREEDIEQVSDLIPLHVLKSINDCVGQSMQFNARCETLSTILFEVMRHHKIDTRLARYIDFCCTNIAPKNTISDKQCANFGLSARQLRRLTQQHFGLSPRKLARVFRFQSMLQNINAANNKTAWADHYHDQSHFIHDFKSLSGITPTQYKSLSVLYNIK